jgi:hypothetical protein
LLVAADYKLDLGVIAQGVEDGIDFCAGNAEDHTHAGIIETVDNDLSNLLLGLGRHTFNVIAPQNRLEIL